MRSDRLKYSTGKEGLRTLKVTQISCRGRGSGGELFNVIDMKFLLTLCLPCAALS